MKHVKNSPTLMENLVEDIVRNPALLKKVLVKILPRLHDEAEVKNEIVEHKPWKDHNYRPERSSNDYDDKSRQAFH